MITLDTSVVVAFMNRRDDDHERVAAWMESVREELVTTPMIVAEIDHLVSREGGSSATINAAKKYQFLELGIADSSLLALAARRRASPPSTNATSVW